jgi:hypothetical protein
MLTIGGMAASLALPAVAAADIARHEAPAAGGPTDAGALFAQAEGEGEGAVPAGGEGEGEGAASGGEGEGEGAAAGDDAPPKVALLRDIGFMTGHMRAGMALYEEGDVEAAKTHMGHPIEEKYDAVADDLEALGHGDLREDILALSAATEAGAPPEEVRALFDAVIAKADAARDAAEATAAEQLLALALLGKIAAEEYAVALEGGSVSNLHEYQDSWGFLRTIEPEAGALAESSDPAVAEAAQEILAQVEGLGSSYGDLQGEGIQSTDPSVLHGAAARMELAALGVE